MKVFLSPLLLFAFVLPSMAAISITTTSVPNGTVGTAYSAVIRTGTGCTPFTWSIVSGSLPAGVTKTPTNNTSTLTLSGTPTKAASYSFTVEVKGCGGNAAKESYKVTIQSGAQHVVDLSWNESNSNNVTGYNIYRSPDKSSWKKINASLVGSTLYDDSTVANGSTYYYAVTTVDAEGTESKKSTIAKAVIP